MKFFASRFLVLSKRKAPKDTLGNGGIFLRQDKTNWLVACGLRATSWGPIHDIFERYWKVLTVYVEVPQSNFESPAKYLLSM
jgi:hypothetical protein